MNPETLIISLGGSLISPDGPDTGFLSAFRSQLQDWYGRAPLRKAILITGGGCPARLYQNAARVLYTELSNEAADWVGIRATHLNGELVRATFGDDCPDPLVTDPTAPRGFRGKVLVAAGWKPGFSTDFVAVLLAELYGVKRLINLSNITQVFTADPKKEPTAKPLDHVSWENFQRLVGTTWTPGANLPFDPIATSRARELGLEVVVAGSDVANLKNILEKLEFTGTRIYR